MEWDWAMIKNLTGHVRFSRYEVQGFYQQTTLTRTLIISRAILSELFNASSGGKCDTSSWPLRCKQTARRLASNINLYMACYKTPHFLFQRTLFLFHVHFPCYIFLFPYLEEKESTSMEKWTAFLSHFTIICIMTQSSPAPVRFDDKYSIFLRVII